MAKKYQKVIGDLGNKKTLSLKNSNIGEDDMRFLAEALKNSKITVLDLSNNNIGYRGLKYLADVLKDTEIKELNLSNNNVRVNGVKCLAKVMDNAKIERLNLAGNKIDFKTAEVLIGLVSYTVDDKIYFNTYCAEIERNNMQTSHNKFDNVGIQVCQSDIGIAASEYIQKNFCKVGIKKLEFTYDSDDFGDDADILFHAFKNIKISKLVLDYYYFRTSHHKDLIYIFKRSQIGQLCIPSYAKLRNGVAAVLAYFIEKIKILELEIRDSHIEVDSMKSLAWALKNSCVIKIDLSGCYIGSDVKDLAEILPNSQIVFIDLSSCHIEIDGAKFLANGLVHSQVTGIDLSNNDIEYEGYQALLDVVDDTNLSWVNLIGNNIGQEFEIFDEELGSKSIPRNTTSIACNINNTFKALVSLSLDSGEFEFMVPKKNSNPSMTVSQYAFLIGTLKNNPNTKAHIIYATCKNGDIFDFDRINQIEDFIVNIVNKFISFTENSLPNLLVDFTDDDYVGLVKQFEELKLSEIVQNLLLHRILYYVDDNQEILHSYIYKLLNQYNMPLYNSELEPNKKKKIISFYKKHQEFDGAKEVLDLLK